MPGVAASGGGQGCSAGLYPRDDQGRRKDSTFTFKYRPRSQPIEVKLYSLQSERAMPLGTQLLRDKIEWEEAFKAMHKNAAKMEKGKKLAAKIAQQANGGATASINQALIRCNHLLK